MERASGFVLTVLALIYVASSAKINPKNVYKCPEGDFERAGFCYKRVTEGVRGDNYEESCKQMHYDTLTILSAEENDFILNNIIPDGLNNYWIGLHDRTTEGHWEWYKDGAPLGQYQNWAPTQPDDDGRRGNQDCGAMWVEMYWNHPQYNGTWDDQRCSKIRPYICQREAGAFVENVCEGVSTTLVADPVDKRCFYFCDPNHAATHPNAIGRQCCDAGLIFNPDHHHCEYASML